MGSGFGLGFWGIFEGKDGERCVSSGGCHFLAFNLSRVALEVRESKLR